MAMSTLQKMLGQKNLRVVDASLPRPLNPNPRRDHEQYSIPSSQFFDIQGKLSDNSNPVPVMLPSTEQFIQEMRHLDIRVNDTIVCYD